MVVFSLFLIACGNATELLEAVETTLNLIALTVDELVKLSPVSLIVFTGNVRANATTTQVGTNLATAVTLIHLRLAVPLHRLAQIMGHDSLNTTMIYIRGTQGDLQRETDAVGELSARQENAITPSDCKALCHCRRDDGISVR